MPGQVLLLIDIWPDTLLLAALFGLIVCATNVFAGPRVGDWVDHTPCRLQVVRTTLLIGNISIVSAAVYGNRSRHFVPCTNSHDISHASALHHPSRAV